MRAFAGLSTAFVAGLLCLGCGPSNRALEEGTPSSEGVGSPRFARSFLPVGSEWISELDIPSEPQKTPRMVIWELSEFADQRAASPVERALAEDLVARSWKAAEKYGWFDFQQGLSDGYRLLHGDKRHYFNEDYVFDDVTLDPERPEFLMYYGTPKGQKLAGLMFYAPRPKARGPQLGGPLTVWHYHVWSSPNCLLRGLLSIGAADSEGRCERGKPSHRSPEMLHVWFLDHPEGAFATGMWLQADQLRRLIERDEQREATRRARPRNTVH